jgi:hypothetical protein
MEESLVGDAFLDMIEDDFRALILKCMEFIQSTFVTARIFAFKTQRRCSIFGYISAAPSIDQLSSNAVALFAISEATPTSIGVSLFP